MLLRFQGTRGKTLSADKFAVWDQFADKSKGLPALQNPALRDTQYIPNITPKTQPNKAKQRKP